MQATPTQSKPSQVESTSPAGKPENAQSAAPKFERRAAKGTMPASIELEPHLEELCDMATD